MSSALYGLESVTPTTASQDSKMKNNKKKVIISALLAISMCFSLIAGATYAIFTSEAKVNIAVTSGKVNVTAKIDEETIKLYSMDTEQTATDAEGNALFENGGSVYYDADNAELKLTNVTPGDKVTFNLSVTNSSNVKIQYRVKWSVDGELKYALAATADGNALVYGVSEWNEWAIPANGSETITIPVSVELPVNTGNEYQEKEASILFTVEAIQGNGPLWSGETDTAWFFENPKATEYSLSTAEQLAGLAQLVDGTAEIPRNADPSVSLPVTFEGKTIKLTQNVNLKGTVFEPIGSYRKELPFKGTFDGQGYTISNLSQNTWDLNNGYYYSGDLGLGLFGYIEEATIKNLKIDKADISGESAIVGTVAAIAIGDCRFENITVTNTKGADYQYYAGGIVGWASGNHEYFNCNVDASTSIAAQWGDFDNSTGGLIGGCGSDSEILVKDCTIACRLDVYNDVTSSYQYFAYRRAGMIIGNTGKTVEKDGTTYADAPQLTCENVTVVYGEWSNYHYCEFAGTSWPYVRVEAGVSNSAYSNPRYGHPTDANGNTVVDGNHVHNDGEDHNIVCKFDQLYGGGQGVYGAQTHEGVKLVYKVASAEDLISLNGGVIKDGLVLSENMTLSASDTKANSGYGATGIKVDNGILDGNGKTLTVNDAWGTWGCAVNTTGGTIKNLTINSAMRGIFMGGATADVYVDNVTIDGTVYTFNSDAGNKAYGVYFSNSTLNGWTSFSDAHKEVVFTNCSFGEGQGYKFCRPYNVAKFVNCDFCEGFEIDPRAAITFENCTINGVALTAENLSTLVTSNIANATVK